MNKIKNVFQGGRTIRFKFCDKIKSKVVIKDSPVPFYTNPQFNKYLTLFYSAINIPVVGISIYLVTGLGVSSPNTIDIARICLRAYSCTQFLVSGVQYSTLAISSQENMREKLHSYLSSSTKSVEVTELIERMNNNFVRKIIMVISPAIISFVMTNFLLNANVLPFNYMTFSFFVLGLTNLLTALNAKGIDTPYYNTNLILISLNVLILLLLYVYSTRQSNNQIHPFKPLCDMNRMEGIKNTIELERDELMSIDEDMEGIFSVHLTEEQILKLEELDKTFQEK